MSGQTNERAFESYVEAMLLEQEAGSPAPTPSGMSSVRCFPARVCAFLEETQPKLWGEMRDAARRWPGGAADRRAGQGARPQGHAARAAPRLQVLRQDLPARLLQAGARPERRGAGALRQEPAHDHAAGALPSGQARHGGHAVRGERAAGGDLRAEESRAPGRTGAMRCGSTRRTAIRARRCSASRRARWCTSPPTRTRCT